jgi:hypothetical protein
LTFIVPSDFASRVLPSAAAASAAAAMRRAFRASVATMVRVTVAPPSLISLRHCTDEKYLGRTPGIVGRRLS